MTEATSSPKPDCSSPAGAPTHCAGCGHSGVVVLGMGRSGTSAVTRMFQRSGYFLGADAELIPADEANPTGHFEHWEVYRANEMALDRLGASWFDVPDDIERHAHDPAYVGPLKDVLSCLLAAADGAPLALKDPRIGVILELWWPLLEDVLHPVLVVRDPVEVALSLEQRDLTAVPVGLAMWEVHVTRLLTGLDQRRVTVIPYRQVLDAPGLASRLVAEASDALRPAVRTAVEPANAGSALDPRHRRNMREGSSAEGYLTPHQDRLWRLLASLAPGTCVLRAPLWATRASEEARMLTAYENRRQRVHARVVGDAQRAGQALASANGELAAVKAALAERDRQMRQQQVALNGSAERLAESSRRVARLEDRLSCAEQARTAAERQLLISERWLGAVQRSLSWRATEPLRRLKRGAGAVVRRARS